MPRKINHANRFFKAIKDVNDAHDRVPSMGTKDEDGYPYWTWYSHDAPEDECIKRDDGLWEHYQAGRRYVFVWRYAPDFYNGYGKPIFSHDKRQAFVDGSETEKVMYTYKGYEFVWMWDEPTEPTWCVWGFTIGDRFWRVRKDGEILIDHATVKKHFREDVAELFDKLGVV